MNTKKLTAALVVLMMAASGIALLPFAEEQDAGDVDIMSGASELNIGETLGTKMTGKMSMSDALGKIAPTIKEYFEELAKQAGMTTDELIKQLDQYLPDETLDLLKKIVNDPQSVTITKQDIIYLVNNLGLGITLNDIDFSVEYEIINATKRIAKYEYRSIGTANITVGLTLDIAGNDSIPNITIKDAKLNIRTIDEATITMDSSNFVAVAKGEISMSFTGTSNFIDDTASSINSLINFNLGSTKTFNIPLDIKATATCKLHTDSGFILPTVPDSPVSTNAIMDAEIEATATTDVAALKSIFTPSTVKENFTYSTPCSVEYFAQSGNEPEYYVTTLYVYEETEESEIPVKKQIGTIYSSGEKVAASFEYGNMYLMLSCDLENNVFYLVMQEKATEEESEEPVDTDAIYGSGFAGLFDADLTTGTVTSSTLTSLVLLFDEETWSISINGTSIDLTDLKKEIESMDIRYGNDYVLTTDEVDKFEIDVSKTAYSLDYDIKGFTGKDLNEDLEPEKKLPISYNMMILITIVVSFLIVIAVLAISSRRNKP